MHMVRLGVLALALLSWVGATAEETGADVVTETYLCEDGTRFDAAFDNSRTYSIAVLSLNDQPEIPLIQAPSGSGVIYSNGDYTLHTKGDFALLTRGDKLRRCNAE